MSDETESVLVKLTRMEGKLDLSSIFRRVAVGPNWRSESLIDVPSSPQSQVNGFVGNAERSRGSFNRGIFAPAHVDCLTAVINNLLWCHASRYSSRDITSRKAKRLCKGPLRGVYLSKGGDRLNHRSIPALLLGIGPPAVFRRIIFRAVDPVKRVLRRRLRPHVGIECLKRVSPPVADANPARAIMRIRPRRRLLASPNHAGPSGVGRVVAAPKAINECLFRHALDCSGNVVKVNLVRGIQ